LILGDRNDPEVELRSQSAVQPYFLLTEISSFLERREIQESEVDGFLYLVDMSPGKKEKRDVRFGKPDFLGLVGIDRRIKERFLEEWDIHNNIQDQKKVTGDTEDGGNKHLFIQSGETGGMQGFILCVRCPSSFFDLLDPPIPGRVVLCINGHVNHRKLGETLLQVIEIYRLKEGLIVEVGFSG